MSFYASVKADSETIVDLGTRQVRVRAINSADLIAQGVAALVMTRGVREDARGRRKKKGRTREESEVMEVARLEMLVEKLSGAGEQAAEKLAKALADLEEARAAVQATWVHSMERLGETNAAKLARIHQARVCAGVTHGRTKSGDEWDEWQAVSFVMDLDQEAPPVEGADVAQDGKPPRLWVGRLDSDDIASISAKVDALSTKGGRATLNRFR